MAISKLKKRNKIINALVIILIVIGLVGVGYFFILLQEPEIEPQPEEPVKEIDDRISPLTQQAVFLEIHRIRRKGVIIDQIMNDRFGTKLVNRLPIKNIAVKTVLDSLTPGIGWDKKPIFNYIAVFDNYSFEGKTDFKAWDTDYINHDLYKIMEKWNKSGTGYIGEKERVEIEFTFLLKEKKIFRTITNEVESFKVVYDFRTGRWGGDDYFNDSDGYGHYNGSDFEMWFDIKQSDIDGDGIPFWTEVNVLETNPRMDDSRLDPDEDGIPTSWEWKWGYDPKKWDNHSYLDPENDGLQNDEEYFMEKWLANPFYPEIYIEVDHMERTPFKPLEIKMHPGRILSFINRPMLVKTNLDGWEHIFYEESQQMIMDRFNEYGITVHVDDGRMGGGEVLPFAINNYETEDRNYGKGAFEMEKGLIAEYYNNNFADERKGIFRYLLILPGGGETFNLDFRGYYDTMTVPTNKKFYLNQLGVLVGTPRMKRIGVAISVLHELGHTLGIQLFHHGGVDNTTEYVAEVWDDYKSVMSYVMYGRRLFDYSDGTHGEMDKDDWGNLDIAAFQKICEELEGVGFDKNEPPFYR
jgi:hypothetical protein